MTLTVTISSVDGETHYTLVTTNPALASDYLAAYDQEGCAISLTAQTYNDEVYDYLHRYSIPDTHDVAPSA